MLTTTLEITNKQTLPLLILDLDETLIYGADREKTLSCDFRVGPFYIYKRPHLDEFLHGVGKYYQLAIWSSASWDYVSAIAQHILPPNLNWAFVWSRERCTTKRNLETFETEYIKDLRKAKRLGYNLAQVLIVDDTRQKVARQYGNAIYVSKFEGDYNDAELPLLLEYLKKLTNFNNFRSIEKRGWRHKIVDSNLVAQNKQEDDNRKSLGFF